MGLALDFNDSTPAAPSGRTNVKWQRSGSNPVEISANIPTAPNFGGVDKQTGATYTLVAGDQGKLVVMTANGATLTLPSGLAATFRCTILFLGTATNTITAGAGAGTVNGVASVTVPQNGAGELFWDGSNWWFA